jgi:hypothetical protein
MPSRVSFFAGADFIAGASLVVAVGLRLPPRLEGVDGRGDLALDLIHPLVDERYHEAGRALRDAGAHCLQLIYAFTTVEGAADNQVSSLSIYEIVQGGAIGVADGHMIEVLLLALVAEGAGLAAADTILLEIRH